ncbi:hypothetical protein [Aeromonas veronii]|uniref:hypothetical protein n=1 Tax=Aeromonas veronii TaxID=654 RepID=UPI00130520E0|nr:hypothetical protein [Aeromonas veronii]
MIDVYGVVILNRNAFFWISAIKGGWCIDARNCPPPFSFINNFISAIFTDGVAFKAIHVCQKGAGGPAGNEVLDKRFALLLRCQLLAKGFVDQHHDMVGLALTTRADALFSG